MAKKKNAFLSNYILIQSIFILILIVIFLYLRKQLAVLDNNPKVVSIAHEQVLIAEDISETCLLLSTEKDEKKRLQYAEELKEIVKQYKESKPKLFKYLHESGIHKDAKKKVSELFEKSGKFLNSVVLSSQLISEKYNSDNLVLTNSDLILKNKTRYSVSITKILDIFDEETHKEIKSIRSKEQFLFISSLFLSVFNLIVIVTPIKRRLLGLNNE